MYLASLRALTRAIDEARRANAAKTRFRGDDEPRMRSPSQRHIGMSEVLTSTRLSPEQRECADIIQTSAQSLLIVVEDVLNFAAIEAASCAARRRVSRCASSCARYHRAAARAASKSLQLSVHMDEAIPDQVSATPGT